MARRIGGIVAVSAAVVMAVTGCSADTDGDAATAKRNPPVVDGENVGALLPQSLEKIRKESFRFTSAVTLDDTRIASEGAYDMALTVGEATVDIGRRNQQLDLRILDSDVYVKMAGRWIHLNTDKLQSGHMLSDAANPVANADYLLAVSDDVKEHGDGRYEGTLDLKRYADKHADPADAENMKRLLAELGPEASTVPFEATVDKQGRLTGLKTTMTVTRDGKKGTVVQESTYSDFGTAVNVQKPPADETVEAPSGLYRN